MLIFLFTDKGKFQYWGEEKIQIGRAVKPIDYWLGESGAHILRMLKLSEDQIAKYTAYITIIKSIHENDKKE